MSESSNSQAMSNRVAKQAVYALARLGGLMSDTPENPAIRWVKQTPEGCFVFLLSLIE